MTEQLRSSALQTSRSVFGLKVRAEEELREAKRDLEVRTAELAAALALRQATLEASPDGILVVDLSGKVVLHNKRLTEMWGFPDDLMHRPGAINSEDFLSRLENPEALRSIIESRVREPEAVRLDEFRLKDGRTLERFVSPQKLDGRSVGIVITWHDITARADADREIRRLNEALERRVAERTRQLEVSNSELRRRNDDLDAFSYSVAHDLRTPIRAISSFSALLQSDHAGGLDERGMQCLMRIRNAIERVELIIVELLNLAKAGNQRVVREPVDVAGIAAEVVARTRAAEGGTVRVEIQPMRTVDADPALVSTVLENLIGNAWKYCSRRGEPRIGIGEADTERGRAFFVEDNGVGFDPLLAEKLFRPFQRLHDPAEFPGTGIGLATVKRVVELHGGRVWARSRPGEGATFYFTLERP